MSELYKRYNELNADQRKMLIFGLAIVGAIAFLLMPSLSLPHFGREAPPVYQKPSPAHVQPVQPVLSATQPAAPVAPVITVPTGRFKGSGPVADRGICNLMLEVKPPTKPGPFSGYMSIACVPLTAAQRTHAGPGLTVDGRNNAAIALMLNNIKPSSYILSGVPDGDILKLHVDDSASAPSACTVTDMTIRDFGGNAVLVKWNEQACTGGSMTLGKLR